MRHTLQIVGVALLLVAASIPAFSHGTSLKIDKASAAPGEVKEVNLIPYGGRRVVYGFNALVSGRLDDPYTRTMSLKRCKDQGYGHSPSE